MPLYAVYHTDYISAGRQSLIDKPAPPYILEARNPAEAAVEVADIEDNPVFAVKDESAIINLDVLFEYLARHGYRIEKPANPRIIPRV